MSNNFQELWQWAALGRHYVYELENWSDHPHQHHELCFSCNKSYSSTIIMTMMMLMITTNRFEWTILVLAITSLGLKHDADVDSLKVLPHHH